MALPFLLLVPTQICMIYLQRFQTNTHAQNVLHVADDADNNFNALF